jgi:hypothetical protein
VSAFRIQELTGDRRNIRLVDRALPYRPFRLTTVQRCEVDWNGGYDQGTANVMGAQEAPSTLHGMWKDMFISERSANPPFQLNGSAVDNVRDAIDLMEDVCRTGQLLQVSWYTQLRHGILTEFEASWENENDVAYTMKFEWTSRGQAIVPSVISGSTVASASGSLRGDVGRLIGARIPRFPMAARYFNFINDNIEEISRVVEDGLNAAMAYSQQALQPFAAVQRMISTCQRVISLVGEFILQLESNVIGAYNDTVALQNLGATAYLQTVEYIEELKRIARSLRRTAIATTTDLFPQVSNQILAVHYAIAGQHLREVSFKYYRTPNNWQSIMHYNGLVKAELSAGQTIMVPKPEILSGMC